MILIGGTKDGEKKFVEKTRHLIGIDIYSMNVSPKEKDFEDLEQQQFEDEHPN